MIAALALTLAAMPQTPQIIAASFDRTNIVGHRGAAAYAPENSLEAFRLGWESGAPALECDIHMSSDGVPMVMHDATLDRTTELTGRVDATTAAEMKRAGVPTLDELLDHVRGKAILVIEIKAGVGVEKAVVDRVRRRGIKDEVIVFSFNQDIVRRVKELGPEIFTVWLSSRGFELRQTPELLRTLRDLNADAVGFQYRNVTPGLADVLRRAGRPLFVWTVPPGEEVDRLKALRVNFIITDHPRDVRTQLGI
jgi:glycerophosphoryl diester phosphodiesterase